jgi:hypothetical protein
MSFERDPMPLPLPLDKPDYFPDWLDDEDDY